jgi:fibrillarin-like pre-rRNA processing protein
MAPPSSGTTASHVSDIIGNEGFIIALDFSPRTTRDLLFLSRTRKNMAPLLADAFKVESYSHLVPKVDVVFQDIAQRNQVDIFVRNVDSFLVSGGFGLIAIKARSIDVTKKPKDIFKRVRSELEKKYSIVDYRELDPYEKDHALFMIKKR